MEEILTLLTSNDKKDIKLVIKQMMNDEIEKIEEEITKIRNSYNKLLTIDYKKNNKHKYDLENQMLKDMYDIED